MAITVRLREAATPLVVSVLPAQRRFAVEASSAITTQSPPGLAAASARSTVSWGEALCLPPGADPPETPRISLMLPLP